MIENILSKLGATQVVETRIRSRHLGGGKVYTYNNGLETVVIADIKIGQDMEVASTYNKFEVYRDDKIIFSYEYFGDGSDKAYEECFNNLYLTLEKTINELLTPCKPSKKKIERLAKMTIENGCTIAEALTAKVLMNKLIFRSCLS